MLRIVAVAGLAITAPAQAATLFTTNGFTAASAAAPVVGQYVEGPSAAAGWNVWNNTAATTTSTLLSSFQGRSNVLHIVTTGGSNGIYRFFGGGAITGFADFWVASGSAMYLAAQDGNGITSAQTSTIGGWERVSVNTGRVPFNEIALYSAGAAADFYISGVSAADATAGVPEPGTWAMMIAGFGLIGSSLRRRSANVRFA